jgi:hypothetical protein
VLSGARDPKYHMAGSYYSENDMKWGRIRTAERREQAEWDACALERARALSLRQQWCRDEATKRKKLEVEAAEEISRQETLTVLRSEMNQAQELYQMDSSEEQEWENQLADIIDDVQRDFETVSNLARLVFTKQVMVGALVWLQTTAILSYVLDLPAAIGITAIVGGSLLLKSY